MTVLFGRLQIIPKLDKQHSNFLSEQDCQFKGLEPVPMIVNWQDEAGMKLSGVLYGRVCVTCALAAISLDWLGGEESLNS